jgi:hypothetical protein
VRVRHADRGFPLQLNRIIPYSGLLRDRRWIETDFLGIHVRPIYKGPAVQEVHP